MATPVNESGFTPAQQSIVDALKTFTSDAFTHENADACVLACDTIADAFRFDVVSGVVSGSVDPSEPVQRAGIENLTTLGLVANRISNLAFRPGDAVPAGARGGNDFSYLGAAQLSICKKFRAGLATVLEAAIDARGKLEFAPAGAEPSELAQVSYLVDTENTALLQRVLEHGVALDFDAVRGLSLKALAGALCDTDGFASDAASSSASDTAFAKAFVALTKDIAVDDRSKLMPVQDMLRSAGLADIEHGLGALLKHRANPISRKDVDLGFRNALLRGAQPALLQAFLPHVTDVTGISLGLGPKERTNLPALLEQRWTGPAKFLVASTSDALDFNEAVTFANVTAAKSVLALACVCGDLELTQALVERGARFASAEDYATTTIYMALEGDLGGLALLREQVPGFDIDACVDKPIQNTLLCAAALGDHHELVSQLLEWGADPDLCVVKDAIVLGSSQKQRLDVNFVQEAVRADSPLALDAAAKALGADRVSEMLGPRGFDSIPRISSTAKRCTELVRAWQAGAEVGSAVEALKAEAMGSCVIVVGAKP